ncbi:MAG: hypothetical protein GWN99_02065 [Gemmatimonadetes bacterium]|uniref:Peptidase C14 caspase domain-containing protein n=1 Tax=Candidatus Kutchimonas denitrificans TaxID=3056748 RepID=A0AAE4Z9X8_9BACT|nr:hypothetical protein [Gemmatimonadota bacterium]NIR74231.1 hypothetical protein [Candidatus Kutchimonas denitrificans]NIR99853.1 hypothetical protein [Gemmatimonadota bacterium]NIT65442.1 hypothetical protein [Gemmatimonadota bacterium]NIU51807.1 hypothetical protein [Gemmatimonadota bacterium]
MPKRFLFALSAGCVLVAQVATAQTDWEQQVTEQIRVAGEVFSSEGYRLIGSAHTGALNHEASDDFKLVLQGGWSYFLVGACDADCPDIDLRLLDASGREVGRDFQDDAFPIVEASPTGTGDYSVHVYMASCTREPCYYGVGIFARSAAAETQASAAGEARTYRGRLEDGDGQLSGNEYYDTYTVASTVGDELVIDLRSREFDPFLILLSPSRQDTQNDDFENSTGHSRIEKTVDETGDWTVVVTSYRGGESGEYELSIATTVRAPAGAAAARVEHGRLERGDSELTTGEYYDLFSFSGSAGEQVVVDLRSADFDPYLILVTPEEEGFENDDHEGSAERSMVSMELPATGGYDVIVTSYKPGESGAYDLRIEKPSRTTAAESRIERGRLESGDQRLETGEYFDGFEFEGVPGQRLRLDVGSDEFDTYLILVDPNGEHLENDDAEGLPGHSVIETQVTESGTYLAAVTSYKEGETGAYQLEMEFGAGASTTSRQRDVQAIAMNGQMSGRLEAGDLQLEAGEYGDVYVFEASAGESVRIDMTSPDFDTYLVLLTPGGEQIDNDDFDGSRERSRIDLDLRESGRYRIIATSYAAAETGTYQVALAAGSGAAAPPVASAAGGRIYGVFMGISDYPGESNDLAYTAEDAMRVRNAMSAVGMSAGDAIVLTDDAATAGNLRAALHSLNDRMGPDDVFVLFYSGHGNRVPRSGFQPSDPDAMDETIELFDGPLTDDQLNAMFAELNAGTSLIVLDACFSGGFAKDVISVPGRMGLFSSEEDVTSSVAAKFRAGGYLAAFLADAVGDGLADGDGDGGVSALELSQYIHERYRADVKSAEPGSFVRTGGPQLGYQHLVVDRGSIGPYDVLFRLQRSP